MIGISFCISTEERSGAAGGSFHMPEQEFRNIAAVVVGEPTGARPLAGHKGALWLSLSSSGRTSHASMPEKGDSALAKMLPAANRLLDFVAEGRHPFMGRGTSVLSTLHSGLNALSQSCPTRPC